jgi:hypothetical protein
LIEGHRLEKQAFRFVVSFFSKKMWATQTLFASEKTFSSKYEKYASFFFQKKEKFSFFLSYGLEKTMRKT